MAVLVTGGAGRLARALRRAGREQVAAPPRADLDITDADVVARALDTYRPAVVVNPAAASRVDFADAEPEAAFAVNAVAPGRIAELCAARAIPLIHISTDYVFGAATDRPWTEDDPVSPVQTYGRGKAEGERRALAAGGRLCVVRVAWLFGDGGDFIAGLLRRPDQAAPVRIAGDQIGSPTPIDLLAGRLLDLAGRMAAGWAPPPILHIAGSPPVSRYDWVAAAFEGVAASGRTPPPLVRARIADFPADSPRPHYNALDTSRADALFGGPIDWRARAVKAGTFT
jgi:dTDP-4-dehydrorhamnose reductase